MNVSFISLGCDKNRVNTEQMMALCLQAGHTVQEDCSGSDVVVINTCGFIDSAKSEAIDTILAAAELKAAGEVGKISGNGLSQPAVSGGHFWRSCRRSTASWGPAASVTSSRRWSRW